MFGRVAACAIAALLLIVPTVTNGEVYLSANAPSADALAADAPSVDAPSVDALSANALSADPYLPATTILLVTNRGRTEVRREGWTQDLALVPPHEQQPVDAQGQQKVAALDPAEPFDKSPSVTDPVNPSPAAAEPFGLKVMPVVHGEILTKWSGVEADIRAGNEIISHCRDGAAPCPSAAQNFLAIVAQGRARTGLARIGVINRAINMAIRPMSDLAQWGVIDKWSAPLETLTTGNGDCEDYAIAKYVALTAAGVAAEDVRLVIVRNLAAGEDHAVVAARLDGNWIILDNRWLRLVEDSEMPGVVPLFVLDQAGVRQFAPTITPDARHALAPSDGVASAPGSLPSP